VAPKKRSKTEKAKLRRTKMKTSVAKQAQINAEVHQQLAESLQRESATASENLRLSNALKESLEQQTATAEILGVIASSPNDLTPVLETIATNAARLCDATSAQVFRTDGEFLRLVANYGELPAGETRPISRGTVTGRAVIEQKTIHANDPIQSAAEFPNSRSGSAQARLATPLLGEGTALGVIGIRRIDMRPFTDSQIKLIETFAKQAVIAIENVRLFKEIQERNTELREALEHQTATAEVLSIISRSPTDVQPVLDAIVESAARVCDIDDVQLRLRDGDKLISRAHFGPVPIPIVEINVDAVTPRRVQEHGTLHIHDVREDKDFPFLSGTSVRTFLAAPLRLQGDFIGALVARRIEVRPFTPAQINLLQTFADQAVIALENVRLFQELEARTRELAQSVGELRALGEVGRAVSSSLDLSTVLNTIVQHHRRSRRSAFWN
jgi:two-component system NtrC family sensor kinase